MKLIKLKYKKIIAPLSSLVWLVNFGVVYAQQSILEKTSSGLQNTINFAFGGGAKTVVTSLNAEGVAGGPDRFVFGILVVISYVLTFVGIVFFLILIYAGYLWMFARGNEDQVLKAKKITKEVIIGIIIIVLARVFTEFISYQLGQATKIL